MGPARRYDGILGMGRRDRSERRRGRASKEGAGLDSLDVVYISTPDDLFRLRRFGVFSSQGCLLHLVCVRFRLWLVCRLGFGIRVWTG